MSGSVGAPTGTAVDTDIEFKNFLKAFQADHDLTRKDVQQFEGTTVNDVKATIAAIQQKQLSGNKQRYMKRLEVFLVSMESYGKVIEAFLNASNYLAFVWASIAELEEANRLRVEVQEKFHELHQEFINRRWPDVRQWLSPYDSNLEQISCIKEKENFPQSGQWLLNDDLFKKWYGPLYCVNPLLWLNGIPGAGKTVLASTVIDALPGLCKPYPIRRVYFYCKEDDKGRNTFVAVARGLLSQLVKDDKDLLLQIYEKGSLVSGDAILEDPEMAKKLLEVALDSSQPTYIIIDGIDECGRDERKEICSWFVERVNDLPNEKYGNLRCLFVSREDGPAKKDLGQIPSIKMEPSRTASDVRRYIMFWQTHMIEKKHGPLDAKFHPLANVIMASTQGMFLFAKLSVRYLYSLPTRQELLDSIHPGQFPEEIGELYKRILDQILLMRPEGNTVRAIIFRLLGILVYAKRPLKWSEIQGYFAFSEADEINAVDHDARKLRDDPLDLCLSLVQRHNDDSIRLIHPTTKRYLVRSQHTEVTRACYDVTQHILAFLSLPACTIVADTPTSEVEGFISKGYYSFLDYAVAFWADHIFSLSMDGLSEVTKEELAEYLGLFLDAHWSGCDSETRIYGKGPSKEEPLNLAFVINPSRTILEEMVSNATGPPDEDSLKEFYGQQYFKCPRVDCIRFYDGFKNREERDRHTDKHERPYSCGIPECPMLVVGYSTEKALQKHRFEFHGLDPGVNVDFPAPPKEPQKAAKEGTVACPHCPKKFTRKFTLRNHLNTHNNLKPFPCRVCDKKFRRHTERKRHEAIHSNARTFVCEGTLKSGESWGCKKTFGRGDKLREHFQTISGRKCIARFRAEQRASSSQESSMMASTISSRFSDGTEKETTITDVSLSAHAEMSDEELDDMFSLFIQMDDDDDGGGGGGDGALRPAALLAIYLRSTYGRQRRAERRASVLKNGEQDV
ncbi:hypothetical protein F5Y15DRAFT_416361 [Xylariaceae sp. FL0016]|nr:hypothetical protein F5Y15DRAFT_416361 [Xylariaceae sp. FL0016]